jgi:hypothetical protein
MQKIISRIYYRQDWVDEFLNGIEVTVFDPAKM